MSFAKVFRRMSDTEYHALDFVSNSLLSELNRSPAHAKFWRSSQKKSTPQMKLGAAIHSRVLEPESFRDRWFLWDGEKRTNAGKAKYTELVSRAQGEDRIIDDKEQWTKIQSCFFAVSQHPAAGPMLQSCNERELSIVFDWHGVRCKARIDAYSEPMAGAIDLKTTSDASPGAFSRSIWDRGYHRQAAMYREALRATGFEFEGFYFVCQETSAPFCTVVYQLTKDAIDQGERELMGLLQQYRECQELEAWPSYSDDILFISLPSWATKSGTTSEIEL